MPRRALNARKKVCTTSVNPGLNACSADCEPGQFPISGGFDVSTTGLTVHRSEMEDGGWAVSVMNSSGAEQQLLRSSIVFRSDATGAVGVGSGGSDASSLASRLAP